MPGADAQRQRQLPGREVRAAEVAHLALAHQIVEGPQRLLERRLRIGRVRLVEVDVVGLQPAQAILDGLEDVPARQPLVVGPVADAHAALGRQHEAVALAL